MRKKKALLFPYDTSLLHMVIHRDTIKEYEIVKVVSLRSWGYCGIDAGAKLGVSTGITVTEDFQKALAEVETVIIADTSIPLECDLVNRYIEIIKSAGKELLDIRYESKENEKKTFDEDLYSDGIPQIRDINKPVVMIVGTGVNTGKFDAQLQIREMFLSEGYKVSQIGSKSYCELWGFHSFPDFMNKTLDTAEKIVGFNHYINYIVDAEGSDIVIVGVPGGVFPLSNKLFDDFGIMNYMVANAVKPDYVILNTGFVDYNNDYIEAMAKALKNRLDYDVDSVFLSNFYINWEATDSLDRLVYMTIPANVVNEEAKICGCYSLYNEDSIDECKKNLFSTLIGYGDFDAI